MTKTLTALFNRHDDAIALVRDLEAADIPARDISILANNHSEWYQEPKSTESEAGAGAGIGASVGALAGGGVGALAGLGMLAIPGIGPVVAAGWLVATAVGAVAGAGVGAASGGIIGSLVDSGVSREDAHVYAEGVRRGGTLVSVRVSDTRVTEVDSIIQRHRSLNTAELGAAYRATGWREFDASAPALTRTEMEKERGLY